MQYFYIFEQEKDCSTVNFCNRGKLGLHSSDFDKRIYRFLKNDILFKGNPNFQRILNWILEIFHHCNKQHKNIENLEFIE